MRSKKALFQQQLCRKCLLFLDAAVIRTSSDLESKAMEAGRAIAEGNRQIDALKDIVMWKSPRRVALLDCNRGDQLKLALDFAVGRVPVKQKIVELCKLRGVGVPMASAILTCIDPDQYTVIDVRALDALGQGGRTVTVELYLQYLEFCLSEAARLSIGLRQLDRALWKAGSV